MPAYFLAGTDTDVGKTTTAVALFSAAAALGYSTLGLKPIAAGCEHTPDGWRNADALALMAASTVPKLIYEEVNPVALPEACSPHIAARLANRRITVAQLTGYVRGSLSRRAELTLVEGAGGWRVPVNDRELLSGLAKELNLPVILVVGLRLGCLNAAILTAEAILRDGLKLAGWVGNHLTEDWTHGDDNIATLHSVLPAPCLGIVPWRPVETAAERGQHLSLSALALPVRA